MTRSRSREEPLTLCACGAKYVHNIGLRCNDCVRTQCRIRRVCRYCGEDAINGSSPRRPNEFCNDCLVDWKGGVRYRTRPRIPNSVKALILKRSCGRCERCGNDPAGSARWGHILGHAGGNPTDATNLRLLCDPCNKAEGWWAGRADPFLWFVHGRRGTEPPSWYTGPSIVPFRGERVLP